MSGIDERAHRKRKFERQKKLYIFAAIFVAVLLVAGLFVKLFTRAGKPDDSNTVTTVTKASNLDETTELTEETTEEATEAPTETTTEEITSGEPEVTTAAPSVPETTAAAPVNTTAPPVIPTTTATLPTAGSAITGQHRALVKESPAVDMSYFSDAVFLGDSRQRDFVIFNGLPASANYSYVSIAVNTVRTKKVAVYNGQKMSPFDAFKRNKNFKKVYLMFGINECGWPYPENFIKLYSELIDDIRAINPKAIIYVQSILPISKKVSQTSKTGTTKANIDKFNALILRMADEKGVYYLDVASVMRDAEGYLPEGAAPDGIHPDKEYCEIWLNYLRTHTVK